MAKLSSGKKKSVVVDPLGEAHIQSTFNNIIITLTNKKGEVIAWSSAGKMNFKGSKKNTPYAAQITAENVAKKGLNAGIKKIEVKVKGPGAGRDAAIRALSNSGILVTLIKDITPLPHNGCRPPKRRRI
ncbi:MULTISPECIES: 30S ribosomal protein S11 [Blattabacterium]|uniref:30S ribosomal protein S11 n=1 Tax=Blattabacterium TaxID=34098 RepID=UPI00023872DE|nr:MULTISPECIES: 30S ribosomal protein S11 [Blattabacterium]AEU09305.1 30S ribosomal protein S11 [Blattabacterium sp. (Cryptocercus punctulatus) str. Cpu]AWU45351.1 30S ribosomal protein S11 [Blattabacterium punctulatus]